MKLNKKRGFTIVELIIVIAVIAILAAVLIPTFGGLINNAQEAKDTANVRMLNQALRADTSVNKHNTMHQAIAAAQNHGIDVTRLTATVPGNVILWDSENDLFAYYKVGEKGEIGEISYIPEFKPASKLQTAYKFWKVSKDVADLKGSYSVYWNGDNMTTAEVTVGFDAGVAEVGEVKYLRTTGDAQSVIIRTNGGSLTVNAPADSVAHYGKASKVDVVAVAGATYNEYGQVGYMQVASGRVVVDSASDVKVGAVLVVAAQSGNANNGVKLEVNKSDVQVAKESGARVPEVVVNGTAVTDVATSTKDEMETKYGTFANGDGSEANPYQIATASDLENLSTYTNNGKLVDKHYVLVADIDLQGKAFVPIGTKDHPFKGTFDGKGHTVSNIDVSGDGYIGLFGAISGKLSQQVAFEDIWQSNVLIENKIGEEKYSTIVKNINIKDVAAKVTNKEGKFVGGLAGAIVHAYVENINVISGSIEGYKGIGGVCGDIYDATLKNATVQENVTITSNIYNVGGITGYARYGAFDGSKSMHTLYLVNCINKANITAKTAQGGGFGGIVGHAGGNSDASCKGYVAISGCENYGKIVIDNGTPAYVAGIVGFADGVKLVANSTNYGEIKIQTDVTNENGNGSVCGIGGYVQNEITFYNCVNKANIEASADNLGGIAGKTFEGKLNIINCENLGTLKNNKESGNIGDLSANAHKVAITGKNYTSVVTLFEEIKGAYFVELQGVTINEMDTPVQLTGNVSIYSDKEINLTLTGNNENYSLTLSAPAGKVTVAENAKVKKLILSGVDLDVKGEICGATSISGDKSTMTVEEGAKADTISFNGTGNYTLTNHGVISHETSSEYRNQHTINVLSQCNVTINNYGTIAATGTNPSYTLLFYGNSTVVFNAYSGSVVSNTSNQGYLLACHLAEKVTFNVQDGAKLLQAGTELNYNKLASQYATVTQMN